MTNAARAHAHRRKVLRFGRVFIPIWIAGVLVLTGLAASDVIWHLGWGYRSQDILLGLGMAAFGVFFWFVWGWMCKLLGWFTDIFIGADPKE